MDRLHRPTQATGGFTGGNQPVSFTSFMAFHSPMFASDRTRVRVSASQREKSGQGITSFRAAFFWIGADSGRLSSSAPVRLAAALARVVPKAKRENPGR